jgi:hypothetical protein
MLAAQAGTYSANWVSICYLEKSPLPPCIIEGKNRRNGDGEKRRRGNIEIYMSYVNKISPVL